MDARVAEAREQDRLARETRSLASRHIQQRNQLIRSLRREDPLEWTYPRLAQAIGVSEELVAKIIQQRT